MRTILPDRWRALPAGCGLDLSPSRKTAGTEVEALCQGGDLDCDEEASGQVAEACAGVDGSHSGVGESGGAGEATYVRQLFREAKGHRGLDPSCEAMSSVLAYNDRVLLAHVDA
jgi:hypothetical protein